MTMIAFACYGDRAEIITDSTSYTANGSSLGHCTKVIAIPHLDMAAAAQGDSAFGEDAKLAALQISAQMPTVDAVVEELPRHLRILWARRQEEWSEVADGMLFIVGYSSRLERFTAWSFASDRNDFEPTPMDVPYVMPSPWTVRPDNLQIKRYRKWDRDAAAAHGVESKAAMVLDSWMSRPSLPAPKDQTEWVALAQRVRQERALESYGKVFVAGDVFHTRISCGEITTTKIHSFDDEGEEFLRLIQNTQHPIAQLLPCWCTSGETYLDCHLVEALDLPCDCGQTGKTFRECCAVSEEVGRVHG